MGRFIILGLALAPLWLLLSGYFDVPLRLVMGALSVVFTVVVSARAGMLDEEGAPLRLVPRIASYWIWLGGEIGKANVAVAREALAIKPRLSPKMFKVPMGQRTAAGKVTFANSITLTPGTVSVHLEEDFIVVHALTEGLADEAAIADMGARVAATEGRTGERR
ncbi:MAG: Na+/H+ antiporter subunit E [Pseudomonadota bacterium]|nr:Na+/H+ antiporter subunit E [Pseudomonadota bacterium]